MLEDERAGADDVAQRARLGSQLVGGRRKDGQVGGRGGLQETGIGFGQDQAHGEVVQHLGVVVAGQVGSTEGGRQLRGEGLVAVEGGFHGVGVEAFAVAEGDVLAQLEGVAQGIGTDLPAFCQPGDDAAGLRVLVGQGLGHVAQQHAVLQPVDLEGVDADQGGVVAPEGDVQGVAGRGVVGWGAGGEGQGQGADGEQALQWGHGMVLH
ncbi:hypothetical protein D3C80_275200 [compost metagenome]